MSLEQDLSRSILGGSVTNIQKLIEEGADVNTNHASETAFTRAIILGFQTVIDAILFSDRCDVNAVNRDERSPLFVAAEYGRLAVVKQLLSLGADINKADFRKTTPLMIAIRVGHTNVARYLIQHGADLNCQSSTGETALYAACDKVNVEIVRDILAHKVDVNVQMNSQHSRTGGTPLMIAVPSPYEIEVKNRKKSDMLKIVRMLLENGSDVNLVDERGNTALHKAADFLDVHTVCVLAQSGTNLQIRNFYSETPFDIAMKKKVDGFSIAICLVLYGYRIENANDCRSVFNTIMSSFNVNQSPDDFNKDHHTFQREALLELLLKDVQHSFELLQTRISHEQQNYQLIQQYQAQYSGLETLTEVCRRIIRRNTHAPLLKGISSLPVAKSLKVFLALDYDYIHNDPLILCDLLLAIQEDDEKIASELMRYGTNLDISILDYTPLTYAASLGNLEMVELLLYNGANPAISDNRGNMAIHEAAGVGSVEILHRFLENKYLSEGYDINVPNADGDSSVMKAAICGKFAALRYLVDNGAECSQCNKNGRYAIHYASASGHLSSCKILLDKGVSVNQSDQFGNTPLHLAASCGLIYTGNNIDLPALFPSEAAMHLDGIRNVLGGKPSTLYFTESKDGGGLAVRHVDVVRLLLSWGADKTAVNHSGATAVDAALQYKHTDIVDILMST